MKVDPTIINNIKGIREYTENDPRLKRVAHHFLYDKRYSDSETIKYIVMGINPGEPPSDQNLKFDKVLEETSISDFMHSGVESTSAKKWRNRCFSICGTLDIALTEALFWSSLNVAILVERYGAKKFTESIYAKFCVPMNEALIRIHNPIAVVFVGIGRTNEIAELYQLNKLGEPTKHNGRRLIAPYTDKLERPWIFIKHFSARISEVEMKLIRTYITVEGWKALHPIL